MMAHLSDKLKRLTKQDPTNDPRAMALLRKECEEAMKTLNGADVAKVEVYNIFDGVDFITPISRKAFNEMNSDLFRQTWDVVERVMRHAKMDKSMIDEVVVVGGCSRILQIQKLLSDYFDGKPLKKDINPEEAVAYGAAIQAAIISSDLRDRLLIDVMPVNVGVETNNGVMNLLIKHDTSIPTRTSQYFITVHDDQNAVLIQVYQGERAMTKDNKHLKAFSLTGIRPAPRGEPRIEITFDVDSDASVVVTAKDLATGQTKKVLMLSDDQDMDETTKDMLQKFESLCNRAV